MVTGLIIYSVYLVKMKNKNNQTNFNYSFLLGSGFSVPKGLPKVGDINTKFTSLGITDFCINSDSTISFYQEGHEADDWFRRNERQFFVEFIADYCQKEISGTKNFQYEKFFDYYYSCYRGEANQNIKKFCTSFRAKYTLTDTLNSDSNLLMNFNNHFVQILAELLGRKEFYENNCSNLGNGLYSEFLNFLKYLIEQGHTVNIHTLNHDILFEHLICSASMSSDFSDGFSDLGSPYYGDYSTKAEGINMLYKVRLKYFQNKYEKPIRFFKLHGSVDTYYFNLASPEVDKTRVKTEYGVLDFYKEMQKPQNKELEYLKGYSNLYPDFLSGTTEKLRSYGNEYYSVIFKHFEENLKQSEKLIIIGYGGWDEGINKILQDKFLQKGIPIPVIDPFPLNSPFYSSTNFIHVNKSISDVSTSEYINL